MSRAAAAVAMHPPAFFQLSYARAQMRCPCSCPLRCVVYRIVYNPQAADGLTPPPSVWSGPVMSGLVWSQKMLITHIWQNFIHRIPLDSL